jgi:hypothetical protein
LIFLQKILCAGLLATVLFVPQIARAQIAEECAGIDVPADYNEERQQAHLNNYFAAGFMMTPLSPIQPFQGDHKASFGIELGLIPPLSCSERLVLGGIKTEDTNKLPINPRPRLISSLPSMGPVQLYSGLTFMPPVEIPNVGSILQAGIELAAFYAADSGFAVGTRIHLNLTRARAEIATPFIANATAYDDLFYASSLGLDVGTSYNLKSANMPWLTPYASIGIADISTLFIIGDDLIITQNTIHPWWGALVALGAQMTVLENFELSAEVSSAAPIFTTAKIKGAYQW